MKIVANRSRRPRITVMIILLIDLGFRPRFRVQGQIRW